MNERVIDGASLIISTNFETGRVELAIPEQQITVTLSVEQAMLVARMMIQKAGWLKEARPPAPAGKEGG